MSKRKEACGLFAIYGDEQAAYKTFLGLQALQHRGQESCGIVSSDGKQLYPRIRMGLVAENFKPKNFFNGDTDERLTGNLACGHVRYSTTGSSTIKNAQPLILDTKFGDIAISHNGNLTNAITLRKRLMDDGAIFQSTTDSEVIGHLIATAKTTHLSEAITAALQQIDGAFSLVFMTKDTIFAARDPNGFRPLCIGKKGNTVMIASETCALDVVGAKLEREIVPGELIIVDKPEQNNHPPRYHTTGSSSLVREKKDSHFCLFELVYFARPDSEMNGVPVGEVRKAFGRQLAREYPVEADIVVPVLDSGLYAALGFAQESGIPLELAFVRNHYVGRTFIDPGQSDREMQVDLKLNVLKSAIKGKRVVIVDDSIVRGNTARRRVSTIRKLGAKEVHMRVSCPPHISPCYYGIDFPTKQELIAANHSLPDIAKFINADSLGYLSLKGMLDTAAKAAPGFCTACWTGKYPTPLKDVKAGLLTLKCD